MGWRAALGPPRRLSIPSGAVGARRARAEAGAAPPGSADSHLLAAALRGRQPGQLRRSDGPPQRTRQAGKWRGGSGPSPREGPELGRADPRGVEPNNSPHPRGPTRLAAPTQTSPPVT